MKNVCNFELPITLFVSLVTLYNKLNKFFNTSSKFTAFEYHRNRSEQNL